MTTTVARRYHFQAQHHIPELPGYDKPHWHDYTIEIVAESDRDRYSDTALIDAWWRSLPNHGGANLNDLYEQTTVEWIASELLGQAFNALDKTRVLSVMVREDNDREGRATA